MGSGNLFLANAGTAANFQVLSFLFSTITIIFIAPGAACLGQETYITEGGKFGPCVGLPGLWFRLLSSGHGFIHRGVLSAQLKHYLLSWQVALWIAIGPARPA